MVEQNARHHARSKAATKQKMYRLEQQLWQVEQRRKIAEVEAAALRTWELAQVQAHKELAREKQPQATAAEQPACNDLLVRAQQAAAATTANGRLGPLEQATLRRAAATEAARVAAEARSMLSATAAVAVEKGGLQPAAVARLERTARDKHTKQLDARNQRRAAAARVAATRRAQVEEERAANKHQLQEQRERRSARRARVCEHMEARRLMEERWAAAQAAKTTLRTANQEHQSDATVSISAASKASQYASKGSLMESADVLLDELLQDCEEDTIQNISEEERAQMEANADNIDFEILDAKGSIATLIKYTVLATVRPIICRQLEFIASSEKELPEPAQHCALLRCLVKLANEDESCSVAALSALHAVVSWAARIKQQEQAAVELHSLRMKLDAIAHERKALEAVTDVLP